MTIQPSLEMHRLLQHKLLENVVSGDTHTMAVRADQPERCSQVRLYVSAGTDDEDDDVENGYAEWSSSVDSVFGYWCGIVGWKVGQFFLNVVAA
jgi:hypothetical protein